MHTRVSEQLSDDIRKAAEELRVPVSNLVRNVLEEAFSVVETVSENVGDLLEEILDEANTTRRRYRRRRHAASDDEEVDDPGHEEEVADTAETAAPESDHPERPAFAEVLGWQPMLLNRASSCADCGRELRRGKRAFVGMTESGLSSTVLCRRCTESRG